MLPDMMDALYQFGLAQIVTVLILVIGAAEFGARFGRWHRGAATETAEIGTLTGASLGLLALLLGFSFSLALSRYDARRDQVLQEANAIGTTANYALMLPQPQQGQILSQLRDYTNVRIGLGVPFDKAKLESDIARSLEIQGRLWQLALEVTKADPQSLPAYRFVASLNEVTNIHESRLTALRYHIPGPVLSVLIVVAMMATGITGYHAGLTGSRRHLATLVMSFTVALVIIMVVDLDSPARGLIQIPVQPLVDAAQGIRP